VLFNEPVFLFAFLPLTLLAVVLAQGTAARRAGIIVLIFASLFFYGWWRADYVLIILGSIGGNLTIARLIERTDVQLWRRGLLVFGIVANLALLGYFKYANFFIDSIASLGVRFDALKILLPIGLSFYTFQQIAFVVDTYRGTIHGVGTLEYMASVLFFPHLIAGPLVQYREIIDQFRVRFAVNSTAIMAGLPIFLVGLTKKLFIADTIGNFISPLYTKAQAAPLEAVSAWVAALGYTAQLYFDFSGYSDMAIGLGLMFGIVLPVNFLSPYKAMSIIDFWRRWHITLSRFLRDYLYIPLGGNRHGQARRYFNLIVVMVVGGLWHGAAWTFAFWGALHGMYLLVNHLWRYATGSRMGWAHRLLSPIYAVLTFSCVVVGWVFFRAPDFTTATRILDGMTGRNGVSLPYILWWQWDTYVNKAETIPPTTRWLDFQANGLQYPDALTAPLLLLVAFAIAWFTPNAAQIFGLNPTRDHLDYKAEPWNIARMLGVAALICLCLYSIVGSVPSTFLYFQF
jgi:D-alanyl-lipoteichoic acid acyltransferase DltB (MBOAT superfamily)